MSGNTPFAALDSDVSPALLPLASQQAVAVSVASSVSASSWNTGDYKVSAQATDHADGSGMWLLCDGTAIPSQWTNLIVIVGPTRPDAQGRALVMKGTNASVNALLANDGQAVANRRPHHRTTNNLLLTDPGHTHDTHGGDVAGTTHNQLQGGTLTGTVATDSKAAGVTLTGSIGTNNANDALDTPAFIVPGNLFIHT